MDNGNSFSPSPMFITERAQVSLCSQIIHLSYLAVEEFSDVRDGYVPPQSDKVKAFKEYQGMEERAYRAITLSLMKMPHIYQAVVSHIDVQPTAAFPLLHGSAAWKRIKAEFIAADNINVQCSTETQILLSRLACLHLILIRLYISLYFGYYLYFHL